MDHPRLCGEKSVLLRCKKIFTGSPPPMRGKVRKSRLDLIHKGITPAYAGKSRNRIRRVGGCGDHPRLCGEKGKFAGKVLVHGGSPPPMRGKGC